jgi:uncharacterized NAD(P)/FAD-binding protein YdhS
MVRYCILGTGFSGTCMMWHLVNTLHQRMIAADPIPRLTEILTIESRAINGPGLPYDMAGISSYHLCNNPAEKMSLFDNDFVDWMLENRHYIIAHHPELIRQSDPTVLLSQWQPCPEKFYPRALFGIYLSIRFDQACALAERHGIEVRCFNGYEAVDGVTRNGKFDLTIRCLKSGARQTLGKLDKVLLASGHWSPDRPAASHVLSSPYPARNIHQSILADQEKRRRSSLTCYVHGMGPSGVDAILSLCEHGRFTYDTDGLATGFEPDWNVFQAAEVKIIAGSRSGFFPGVRWPLLDQEFWYLTETRIDAIKESNKGEIPLAELLSLIDSELRAASHNELAIEDVLKPNFSNAHQKLLTDMQGTFAERLLYTVTLRARRLKFYQDLNAADKRRYDKELDTHFIRIAVPIPLQNARKLTALIDAGVLSTVQLGYQKKLNYWITTIKPDIVICSHGQNYDIRRHPSLLIKNLIESQEVIEYSENGYRPGGICADESSHFRVANNINGYRDRSQHLYSFGPVTQYWQNQNNYAAAFVNAATVVAQNWIDSVAGHT